MISAHGTHQRARLWAFSRSARCCATAGAACRHALPQNGRSPGI